MSLRTLELMAENTRREEEIYDRASEKSKTFRNSSTENLEEKTAAEVDIIRNVVIGQIPSMLKIKLSSPLANDVVASIIQRFEKQGWKAKHSSSDGYHQYDFLTITPPDEW